MPTQPTPAQVHTLTLRVLRAVLRDFGDQMDTALHERIEQVINMHGKALYQLDNTRKT